MPTGSQQLQCVHIPRSAQQETGQDSTTAPAHPLSSISTTSFSISTSSTRERRAQYDDAAVAAPPAADLSHGGSTLPAAGMASSNSSSSVGCGASSQQNGLLHQQLQQQQQEGRVPAAPRDSSAGDAEAEAWLVQVSSVLEGISQSGYQLIQHSVIQRQRHG
jgi:hypothetical protein